MAVLKFKNQNGEWVALTNYAVSPIEPVQTTGSSTTAVMSQNAVTVELNKKANTTDVYTKSEVNDTFLTKSDASSTYITNETANSTFLTQEKANQTFITETEVNQIVYGQDSKPESPVTVVTTENLEETLNNYSTSTEVTQQITAAVEGKADKATTLAGYGITDAKIEGGTITLGSQTITPLTEATVGDYITSEEVDAKIAALVDSAPGTLDTLNELAAALGDDPNFATTITAQIASKADAADYATTEALTSGLAGKANTTHTHTVSQITDLSTTLSGYATTTALTEGLAGKANTSHTHAISDVTNLQDTLDGKAAATHTHTVSQITDLNLGNYATTTSVSQAISDATFNNGHNAVSSVAGIPVSKRLVIATINGNGSFTLASTPADGREIHVIVHNTNSSDIEITMPSGSNYVKMSGDTLTVAGSSYADINVISDGTNMYIRAL